MLKFHKISKKKGGRLLERLVCSVIKIIHINPQMCYDGIIKNKHVQVHKTVL